MKDNAEKLKEINVLIGDQGNTKVLDEWIEKSGRNFDVIIDDGGHKNCQIWSSFMKLWLYLNSRGPHFIEDMQITKKERFMSYGNSECSKDIIVPDKLKDVLDDLMYKKSNEVMFLFCQEEACVLGKK